MNMKSIVAAVVLLTASLLGAAVAEAQQTRLIPFQGRLVDESGAPRNGAYRVTFAIYGAPAGGTALWSEVHDPAQNSGVSVNNGQINVILGALTSLDDPDGNGNPSDAVSFDSPKYLGIKVGANATQEMVPRHQLVPAFHSSTATVAAQALKLDPSATDAVATANIRNGAVTGTQIADSSVQLEDLSPAVRAAIGARAVVNAVIRNGGAQINLPQVGTFSEIGSSTFELTNLPASNVTARIACAGGVSTGTVCPGAQSESYGVSFDVPLAGLYEACVSLSLLQIITGAYGAATNSSQAAFELIETNAVGTPIGTGTVPPSLASHNSNNNLGSNISDVERNVYFCDVFSFASAGAKTIRLRYVKFGAGDAAIIDNSLGGVRFTVKQL